jgi:UDP-N-acetylglucosamine diphosphorylase/glucosamine-1-phosphate N-acetyltransferase
MFHTIILEKNHDFCHDFSRMHIILFDDETRFRLLPFTHTRPVADIRCGIFTMRERWEKLLNQQTSMLTESYLQPAFPLVTGNDNLFVNGAVFATNSLAKAIGELKEGEKLIQENLLIAARCSSAETHFHNFGEHIQGLTAKVYAETVHSLQHVWDIFSQNERAIKEDFGIITQNRKSAPLPDHVIATGKENIFVEEGATINPGVIINASSGFVYLAKDAEILEGAMLRGSVVLGEHAVIKMGAKIYGATTIGNGCKVGGEVSNVVFFANSNKGHDGYLGNAVIGEWCNLGADTNCSNLKNNYDYIKIWDEHKNKSIQTGLQFCGLLMGDHSKCGINTMFNTGTVVGVSANVFGSGFPEKFIPSFAWGGSDGIVTYDFNRATDTAKRMMVRRNKELNEAEIAVLRHIFEATDAQRSLFGGQ